MKIGIDARIYKTGIGRYTRNLIKELGGIVSPDDELVVFLRKNDLDEFASSEAANKPRRFAKAVVADFPPYSFKEQLFFPWVLWRQRLDLVHFTNFNVPVLWPGRFTLTIHDLIHMSHSTFGSSTRNYLYYLIKHWVYQWAIRWVAWRAARIFVPSEATKVDVVERLRVRADKVVVTYEGVEEEWKVESGKLKVQKGKEPPNFQFSTFNFPLKYNIHPPYLLYVATMYPHKNHARLIEAFKLLRDEYPDLQLVLVGKVDYFSKSLKETLTQDVRLRTLPKDAVIFPNFQCADGYLPDEDLHVFYRHAAVYVFPSLKEGFGIPILEAQAHGLPVACARISCLPEIGGDSVMYFDPESVPDIAEQVKRVLEDESLRRELTRKGFENLKRFSWQDMSRKTYMTYKELLKQ